MIVTFPHMGTMHITLSTLFAGLGLEVLPPPPITKKTMDLGTKYAPETACLPFKITLGNFIETLEQGADTIITCGGVGPCRLGYYAQVQKDILKELGFEFELIAIEPNIIEVLKILHRFTPGKSWQDIYSAFKLAGAKMTALDSMERKTYNVRPRETVPGKTDLLWQQAVNAMEATLDISGVKALTKVFNERLDKIELKCGYDPLRIGIVGEIYVMLEPFVNQDMVRQLGKMGVEVHKTMYLTDYVRVHLQRDRHYYKAYQQIVDLAMPYLGHYVGGHAIKSIGCTVQMGQAGLDGVIQVFPFTCMPEIIAKNILPQVSKDENIPLMSLAFDEQSGEAGVFTRLEAFIDLLNYRRMKKDIAEGNR
jgi:predicted nucleotide-binding protein (sugar kinase/HSP70/actin superfamily)